MSCFFRFSCKYWWPRWKSTSFRSSTVHIMFMMLLITPIMILMEYLQIGATTGSHLHFAIKINGSYKDPLSLIPSTEILTLTSLAPQSFFTILIAFCSSVCGLSSNVSVLISFVVVFPIELSTTVFVVLFTVLFLLVCICICYFIFTIFVCI